MSDAELFLLGWAVVATIGYFKAKADLDVAKKMLMYFIQNKSAREEIVGAWEKFKRANEAT